MKCDVCKKDVLHGWYDREGGKDYYFHESCKAQQFLNFVDDIENEILDENK